MPNASLPPPQNQSTTHTHRSFLLRCWREGHVGQQRNWRFSVREVKETPQEYHFNSPGELLDFLLAMLGDERKGAKSISDDDSV